MKIAIIGGGLSGTLLAHYLLEAGMKEDAIYLFEKNPSQLTRGIAYRSSNQTQLLNVRADSMNIPGLPAGDFYQWLLKEGDTRQPGGKQVSPHDFVPRALFGTYLSEVFQKTLNRSNQAPLHILHEEVTDIVKDNDTLTIYTASGTRYEADKVVIANGILPPADPFFISGEVRASELYQANPWQEGYLNQLKKNDHVTLIGTGLTMLDHAMGLLKSDKELRVTVFSRRALLPLPHQLYQPYSFPEYNIVPVEDINELFRTIRNYYLKHRSNGLDWRNLIDRIRNEVPQLWHALSPASKKRFIRHLKPYWEIHRHRAPAEILTYIEKAKHAGRFNVLKGRVQSVKVHNNQLEITLVSPGAIKRIITHYLLNSSGLQQNISLTSDTLLKKLFERGYMIADNNNLGVETNDFGALKCNVGKENIFAIGALRRAAVLECTAAKEIGEHAFQLSKHLLQH